MCSSSVASRYLEKCQQEVVFNLGDDNVDDGGANGVIGLCEMMLVDEILSIKIPLTVRS